MGAVLHDLDFTVTSPSMLSSSESTIAQVRVPRSTFELRL